MMADRTEMNASGLPGKDVGAFDEQALARLLALAGPCDAPELMRRLIADVRDVATGMTAGLVNRDRVAMRKHSHVLLAIAGTIGAQHIYHLAQLLNQCAKDDECVAAEPYAVDLMDRLDRLVDRLQHLSAEQGMGG